MRSHTWGGGATVGNFRGPWGKALLPLRHQPRKGSLARDALLGCRAIRACQHAKRILGGEQFVLGQAPVVKGVAHCSRQAFSLISARRIQLFMVPSGTSMRCGQILISVAVEKCAA